MFPVPRLRRFPRPRSGAVLPPGAPIRTTTAAAILLTLAAGACAPDDPNAFAPPCAPVGILSEAADYTDYGANPPPVPDLGRIVSHGSIAGVSGQCSDARHGRALRTSIRLSMLVDRGPAARGSVIHIPYFVAVVQDGRILRKLPGDATAEFPDNGDKVSVHTDPIEVELPVSRGKPGTSYRFEVGFQLTESQLDYNRAHPAH